MAALRVRFRLRRFRRAVTVPAGVGLPAGFGATPAQAVAYGYSGLWSGVLSNGGSYMGVTAEVTAPRVSTYRGNDSNVVAFVGLGGWNSLPFVQNGFTVTPKGYGVWAEVFDRYGARPGHVRRAADPGRRPNSAQRVIQHGPNGLVVPLGQSHARSDGYSAGSDAARYYNGATADYMVERSWYPYRGSPLARYSTITFSNAKAARGGRWVPAYNTGSTKVTLLGSTGKTLSRVVSASGTTVSTAWGGCR